MSGRGAWGAAAEGLMQGVRLMSDVNQRDIENKRQDKRDKTDQERYEYKKGEYELEKKRLENERDAARYAATRKGSDAELRAKLKRTPTEKESDDYFMQRNPNFFVNYMNRNPEFRKEFGSGDRVDKENPVNSLVPMNRVNEEGENETIYVPLVNAVDPMTGKKYTPPKTENGTPDKDDKVVHGTPYEWLRGFEGRMGYLNEDRYVENQAIGDAKHLRDLYKGKRQDGLGAAVPRAPQAPQAPKASASPFASVQGGSSTTAPPPAPPESVDPDTIMDRARGRPVREGTAAEFYAERDEPMDPPTENSLYGGAMAAVDRGVRALGAEPATDTDAMYYAKHRAALTAGLTPQQIANMDEKKLISVSGNPIPLSSARRGTASHWDGEVPPKTGGAALPAAMSGVNPNKLTPGQVMSKKNQDKIISGMNPATPDETNAAAASIRAPAAGNRGRPSLEQLASALILKARNILTSEQVTRYAETGELTKPELTQVDREKDLYINGKFAKAGVPKGPTWKELQEIGIKQNDAAWKSIGAMLKDHIGTGKNANKNLSMSNFIRLYMDSASEAAQRGLSIDPQAITNVYMQAKLVEAYVAGKKFETVPGFWTAGREGTPIMGHRSLYGDPQPKVEPVQYTDGNWYIPGDPNDPKGFSIRVDPPK